MMSAFAIGFHKKEKASQHYVQIFTTHKPSPWFLTNQYYHYSYFTYIVKRSRIANKQSACTRSLLPILSFVRQPNHLETTCPNTACVMKFVETRHGNILLKCVSIPYGHTRPFVRSKQPKAHRVPIQSRSFLLLITRVGAFLGKRQIRRKPRTR